MRVVWSQTALDAYLHIIDDIFENWTIKEVVNFQEAVDKLLFQLSKNSKLCPVSNLLNYRKCVVSKQTSLIYAINKDSIFLVTFIDNRSLHNF